MSDAIVRLKSLHDTLDIVCTLCYHHSRRLGGPVV
jgi:hypothetical protein